MASLSHLTDEDLESEKKNGAHKREQRIDNAFSNVIVCAIYVTGVVFMAGVVYFAFIYFLHLYEPETVSEKTIKTIEVIATHVMAGAGGYLAHLAKRNLKNA